MNRQCSDSSSNPSLQDQDQTATSGLESQRDDDVEASLVAAKPSTVLTRDILRQAEISQRCRWIAFLARRIALDILRDESVKEDGTHD